MKNTIYTIVATLFFVSGLFAQETKIISGRLSSNTANIAIAEEIKSELLFQEKTSEFIKLEKYSNTFNSIITIIIDSNQKVVSINIPKDITDDELNKAIKPCVIKSLRDLFDCFNLF